MTTRWTGPVRNPTSGITNPLAALASGAPQAGSPDGADGGTRVVWGTVTSAVANAVKVRLDNETDAQAGTPSTLCKVSTGNRVLVLVTGRRMTILGVANPAQT